MLLLLQLLSLRFFLHKLQFLPLSSLPRARTTADLHQTQNSRVAKVGLKNRQSAACCSRYCCCRCCCCRCCRHCCCCCVHLFISIGRERCVNKVHRPLALCLCAKAKVGPTAEARVRHCQVQQMHFLKRKKKKKNQSAELNKKSRFLAVSCRDLLKIKIFAKINSTFQKFSIPRTNQDITYSVPRQAAIS